MPRTKAYRHLGKTTWRANVFLDDGDESFADYLGDAERPNLGLAKAWVNRNLPLLAANKCGVGDSAWARLERGTYEDNSFDDRRDGYVFDASWEKDGTEWFATLDVNGIDVVWSEG